MQLCALLEGTVDGLIDDQGNKNTPAKTDRYLNTFLQTKGDSRNVEEILPANLGEFLSEFILLCEQRREKTMS